MLQRLSKYTRHDLPRRGWSARTRRARQKAPRRFLHGAASIRATRWCRRIAEQCWQKQKNTSRAPPRQSSRIHGERPPNMQRAETHSKRPTFCPHDPTALRRRTCLHLSATARWGPCCAFRAGGAHFVLRCRQKNSAALTRVCTYRPPRGSTRAHTPLMRSGCMHFDASALW